MIDRFSSFDTEPYKSKLKTIFARSQVDEMSRLFIRHRYISTDETIRLSRRFGLQPCQFCLLTFRIFRCTMAFYENILIIGEDMVSKCKVQGEVSRKNDGNIKFSGGIKGEVKNNFVF